MQRKGQIDLWLLITASALIILGLISLLSASSVVSYQEHNNSLKIFSKQVVFVFLGLIAMVLAIYFPMEQIKRLSIPILIVAVLLLIVVLIIGEEINGSKRWINLKIGTLQPSEVAKVAIIIFLAHYLSANKKRINTFKGLLPALFAMTVVGGLIVIEPDLGTTVALMGTCFFMLVASGVKKSHLFVLVLIGILGVFALTIVKPYRMQRLMTFLNYEQDPLGDGYQLIQSIYALGSGGLLGAGLGKSKQKFLYLPEHHTDFIFPIIGEELGFLGTFTVVLLFTVYAWRGLRLAMRLKDPFYSLLAVGLTMQITFQAFLNMGVVTGLLPVTGLTLPFFSAGGSSLLISMGSVGLLLNLSRYTD